MDYEKEKKEAILAGENALYSLRKARECLSSAKRLGIWDIFGGGSLVSFFKHYKVNSARRAIDQAGQDLWVFSRQLRDVSMDLDIYIGDWLSFFDVCTDNWISDIMVQRRISDALNRVDYVIKEVQNALDRLR